MSFITKQHRAHTRTKNHRQNLRKPTVSHNIVLNKPYGVMCQFTDSEGRPTLADFGAFPRDVYPAGRLDFDSEGLVFLTNDGGLKHSLLEPKYAHPRTYLVQIERIPEEPALQQLREGVILDGTLTLPATVELLPTEPLLPERAVPIRFRKNVPTAWLKITITEGKNRQVRRMTAAVGHPALRLVRIGMANITIEGLPPGESRPLTPAELTDLKKILAKGNRSRKNPQRRPSSVS